MDRQFPNIILIGFSYTGKTQVAQRVAQMLGWACIDTDAEIERRVGKSISQVFSQDGEPVFREVERQVLQDACSQERAVISTGGGAVLDPANRELMRRRGFVIHLEAEPQTIYQRLRRDAEDPVRPVVRPLLTVPDPLGRINELKAQREPFYAFADGVVPTDNRSIEEVSQEVVRLWRLGRGEVC